MGKDFEWSYDNPLARAKGERRDANNALWDYVHMGPGRSLAKLVDAYKEDQAGTKAAPHAREEPPTTRLRTLKNWSSRYQWQARLDAWEDQEREREAAKWQERRDQFRETAFSMAERSFERIGEMLAYPLIERQVMERYEDGREKIVNFEPAKWTMLHVARLMAEANKVGLLALGEPTETTEQRHSGTLSMGGDLAHLEDAELNDKIERLLERMGAPGPDTLRSPTFSGRPPAATNGHGADNGSQEA